MSRHPTFIAAGNYGTLTVDFEFGHIISRDPVDCYPEITGFNVDDARQVFGTLWQPGSKWDVVLLADNVGDAFRERFNWLSVRAGESNPSPLARRLAMWVFDQIEKRCLQQPDPPSVVGPVLGTPPPDRYRKGDKVLFWGTIVNDKPAGEAGGNWYGVSFHWNPSMTHIQDAVVNARSMLGVTERPTKPRAGDIVSFPNSSGTLLKVHEDLGWGIIQIPGSPEPTLVPLDLLKPDFSSQ